VRGEGGGREEAGGRGEEWGVGRRGEGGGKLMSLRSELEMARAVSRCLLHVLNSIQTVS